MATAHDNPKRLAVKVYKKSDLCSRSRVMSVRKEIRVLKLLDHPNIIKLEDVIEDDEKI